MNWKTQDLSNQTFSIGTVRFQTRHGRIMIQQAWIIDSRAHAVISEMFLQLIAVLATDGILVENMTTTILRNGNAV